MPSSQRTSRILKALPLPMLLIFSMSVTCLAQSFSERRKQGDVENVAKSGTGMEDREKLENYKGKNGVLSMKTLVLGGDFRVTTIIPFKGNLAEYHHLEITRPVSLVGNTLTPQVSSQQLAKLKSQMEERRIFESVTVIDSFSMTVVSQPQKQSHENSNNIADAEGDSLDSPIGSSSD